MVLHADGPRRIDLARAHDIVSSLPKHVTPVGVFFDAPLPRLMQACETIGLGLVQLHGDETPGYAAAIHAPIIKALPVTGRVDEWPAPAIVLLDAHDPARRGGTGQVIDWTVAGKVREETPSLFLAGGLSAENVGEAIARVRPFGVDACSSLESTPGIKDLILVKAFVRAVRSS